MTGIGFIPDVKGAAADVPFFDDVTAEGGWQGHSTGKSIEALKSEVTASIGRLGGMVIGFQRGQFQVGEHLRDGFRISYAVEAPDGKMFPGRLDIAALPVRKNPRAGYDRRVRSDDARREKSLKMALFMLKVGLDGTWFLSKLSPGFAPLMPWMIGKTGQTITEAWQAGIMNNLLPPASSDWKVKGVNDETD